MNAHKTMMKLKVGGLLVIRSHYYPGTSKLEKTVNKNGQWGAYSFSSLFILDVAT